MKTLPHPGSYHHNKPGFSLVELIVVIAVVAILLAFSVPGLTSLYPARKTALYEVKGFLEYARSEAVTQNRDVYVAFANGSFPSQNGPFRAYAAFVVAATSDLASPDDTRELIQLSEWKFLPEGIVFVTGRDFETQPGASFRTILDSSVTRDFETKIGSNRVQTVRLPFLRFGKGGRVSVPSFIHADALHVGIAEGVFSGITNRSGIQFTGTRPGVNGSGEYPRTECIAINFYTGRTRVITD